IFFLFVSFFFFQAEDGIRDRNVTGVQTCALPISSFLLTVTSVERKKPTKFFLTFVYIFNLLKALDMCFKLCSKWSPSIAFLVDKVRNNQRAVGFSLTTSSITF